MPPNPPALVPPLGRGVGTAGLLCLCFLWPLCLEFHLHINPQPSVTHTAGWPGSNATSSRVTFRIPSSPPLNRSIWTSFGEFGIAGVCRPHQSSSRLVFPEPPHQAGPREHLPRAILGVPLPNFSLIRSLLCCKPAIDPTALGIKSIACLMPPGLTPPCFSSLIPAAYTPSHQAPDMLASTWRVPSLPCLRALAHAGPSAWSCSPLPATYSVFRSELVSLPQRSLPWCPLSHPLVT